MQRGVLRSLQQLCRYAEIASVVVARRLNVGLGEAAAS